MRMISRRLLQHCHVGIAGMGLVLGFAAHANAASAMHTGGLTSQPIGHYEFCKLHESECNIRSVDIVPEPPAGIQLSARGSDSSADESV